MEEKKEKIGGRKKEMKRIEVEEVFNRKEERKNMKEIVEKEEIRIEGSEGGVKKVERVGRGKRKERKMELKRGIERLEIIDVE